MKKADKMNGSSELAEQNLPVNPSPNGGNQLPVQATVTGSSHTRAEISAALDSAISGARPSAPGILSLETISSARSKDSHSLLETTREMIVQNALRTGGSITDSLRVVIKPSGDVQMSLDLQQSNGGVDVQAVLQKGDFDLLNRHWPQLQEQMEARGIRLAPLSSTDTSAGNYNQNFQQQKPSSREQESVPALPGSFAFAGAIVAPEIVPQTSTTTSTRLGWESWA